MLEPYGKFYCHKGGRSYGKSTSKCGFKFSFQSYPENVDGNIVYQIKIDNTLILEHNGHSPNPHITLHELLPDDIFDKIQTLHKAGISPSKIQKFLQVIGDKLISTMQIQSVIYPDTIKEFSVESEALINYMKESGGFYAELNVPSGEVTTRVAVLTIHDSELKNMEEYGDIIFIDGTYASLSTNWEIFPITAITKGCNLCCCGILYAASGNEDVLKWMLHQLADLEQFRNKISTIITDEDHEFINAFDNWIKEINASDEHIIINHILCAFHKSKNFVKKLVKYGLNAEQRAVAENYFQIICYHPNINFVQQTLEKLKDVFGSRLNHYIEKHVEPLLPNFARSYICERNCLGYNTTSPAESMNNLIKRSLTRHDISLEASRRSFDQILQNHQINIGIKEGTARH